MFSMKICLAPMAAVNSSVFRKLCKEYGADETITQMYHVNDIVSITKERDIFEFFYFYEGESPRVVQLIGAVNDSWEEAVSLIESFVDRIDINLGCPEKEMLGRRCGSYLLSQPAQIRKIIGRVKSATSKPISAKIRSGWKEVNAVEISKLLEEEGVCEICVHPRLTKQGYSGDADWSVIKKVVDAVDIPVIGNGDILLAGHAKAMIEQTKCSGVMIGREAMKNPGVFLQVKTLLESGKGCEAVDKKKQIDRLIELFIEHNVLCEEKNQKSMSLGQLKDHICWMISGGAKANSLRKDIRKCESLGAIESILKKFKFLVS